MAKRTSKLKMLLGSGVILLSFGACATPEKSGPPLYLKNPIQVTESVERLELYSRPDGMSLSARDQDAVGEFLNQYARFGDGPLYMNTPNRMTPGVSQTQNLVQSMMGQMGLRGAAMQQGQYRSAQNAPAPVVLSYRRLKAVPRDCSISEHLTGTYANQTYADFGCSQSANLAAMIEDPRQLIHPYGLAPSDMRRRMTVYDKYIKGENPASALPARQQVSSEE